MRNSAIIAVVVVVLAGIYLAFLYNDNGISGLWAAITMAALAYAGFWPARFLANEPA